MIRSHLVLAAVLCTTSLAAFAVSHASGDDEPPHALDPVLELARDVQARLKTDVRDYTATLVKRERFGKALGEHEYMFIKVRTGTLADGVVVTPPGVYLNYTWPKSLIGREVIWVAGRNNGKLVAHEGPPMGIRCGFYAKGGIKLEPNGFMAMRGNRYPLNELGLANSLERLVAKCEHDRKHDECEVKVDKNSKLNGRVCTLWEVKHPVQREHFDFHVAQIFIDNELKVPVRFARYSWPTAPGSKPELEEEYTYLDLKLNVGLTDEDFDPNNKAYKYQ